MSYCPNSRGGKVWEGRLGGLQAIPTLTRPPLQGREVGQH